PSPRCRSADERGGSRHNPASASASAGRRRHRGTASAAPHPRGSAAGAPPPPSGAPDRSPAACPSAIGPSSPPNSGHGGCRRTTPRPSREYLGGQGNGRSPGPPPAAAGGAEEPAPAGARGDNPPSGGSPHR